MSALFDWLRGRRAAPASPSSSPHPEAADLLARARALAAEGRADEASETYWKIKRKHLTPETLVEHAELLLALGDFFGAVAKAARARELDPDNARALAVQAEVRRREDAEQRKG
jgi:Flp pilus assembly protein TadD